MREWGQASIVFDKREPYCIRWTRKKKASSGIEKKSSNNVKSNPIGAAVLRRSVAWYFFESERGLWLSNHFQYLAAWYICGE